MGKPEPSHARQKNTLELLRQVGIGRGKRGVEGWKVAGRGKNIDKGAVDNGICQILSPLWQPPHPSLLYCSRSQDPLLEAVCKIGQLFFSIYVAHFVEETTS